MRVRKLTFLLGGELFFLVIMVLFFSFLLPQDRSIVIFITVEAFRPHLGCYGYEKNITPHIDELANKGILFTSARVVTPLTLVSIPSTLTSTYPISYNSFSFDYSKKTFLTHILRKDGYKTYAFISIQIPKYLKNFFDKFEYHKSCRSQVERAIEELKGREKKLFIWLHFPEPHWPYKTYSRKIFYPYEVTNDSFILIEREKVLKYYDEEIKDVDECVGDLIFFLKSKGLLDRTLLILTGDHGEEFFEHRLMGHGYSLYEEQLRVPLIIYFPKVLKEPKRIDCSVSLVDIAPTILDLLKIEKKIGVGKSLLPIITKKEECVERHTFHFMPTGIIATFYYNSTPPEIKAGNFFLMNYITSYNFTQEFPRLTPFMYIVPSSLAVLTPNKTHNISIELPFFHPLQMAIVKGRYKLYCIFLSNQTTDPLLSSKRICNLYDIMEDEKKSNNTFVAAILEEKLLHFIMNSSLILKGIERNEVTEEIARQLRELGYLP